MLQGFEGDGKDLPMGQSPVKHPDTCVDQTLQRPVLLNASHFETFTSRRPPVDAECEICLEKLTRPNEDDVNFLKNAFASFDTSRTGHVTVGQLKRILVRWARINPGACTTLFEPLEIPAVGKIEYNSLLERIPTVCRTLCVCKPPRWLHNHCLKRKLTMGFNASPQLLRCGYCRTHIFGQHYTQWLDEATRFINGAIEAEKDIQQKYSDQAFILTLNATNAVVQCGGGGLVQNVVLGVCLAKVGLAIYTHQTSRNSGFPTNDLSGRVVLMALLMGAPPSIRLAWTLGEMCWVEGIKKEGKVYWADLAYQYCEEFQQSIPEESGALRMDAALMLLEIKVLHPSVELCDVLVFLSNKTQWPWSINELDARTCYRVCCTIEHYCGIDCMGQ